ncbi:protoheme IX farnesyltransferase [Pokkaliibacter plantistimulans]|uniref:Protoheme IX farnesyltransferase n=1 Tax=Proteobacteria bacterium 228 TaxID=2083153 RepID=A0A2S5KNS7_9PROT|nr:heme o synthase [Pokkaliibacter plantistimulans]PPC76323.1 protoheme IX farnesyltransferase [Pokkaliibacter plantistimulans]
MKETARGGASAIGVPLATLWHDYYALTKPRVVAVMLLTAVVGMLLATQDGDIPWHALCWGTLGIGLAASSAAAINQIVDRRLDALMARTRQRPIPQGHIPAHHALLFAAVLGIAGIGILAILVNPLTAWLTLGSLLGYAVVYTAFLKRATPQNITIGGLAGAAPPLLGWTSISNQIVPESLLLVLIIFAWTPPHFWALAIHKKTEYAKVGIPMLPVTHGEAFTRLHILLYTLLMVLCTLLPYLYGCSGVVYLVGVLILNGLFLQKALWLWLYRRPADPYGLFRYSINYIMLLFVVLLLDHYLAL